jgi:hypothetical protein
MIAALSTAALDSAPQRGGDIILENTHDYPLLKEKLQALGISLAYDVRISVEQCGVKDLYYDPSTNSITVCEEFASTIGEEELVFIIYHELGHALIDMYKLPFTGREEDAADQFATKLLIEQGEHDIVLAGAEWYGARGGKRYDWDDHSFDRQRHYNILCWVYGSDTETFASIPQDTGMHEQRSVQCGVEYKRINRGWDSLLAAYRE